MTQELALDFTDMFLTRLAIETTLQTHVEALESIERCIEKGDEFFTSRPHLRDNEMFFVERYSAILVAIPTND